MRLSADRNSDGLAGISRLALASDFQDYYDAFFDDCGVAFSRVRARTLPPADMFRMLERLEYLVPSHGLVRELADVLMDKKDPGAGSDTKLVVHGPGFKMLIGVQNALKFFPDEYAAEFVGPGRLAGLLGDEFLEPCEQTTVSDSSRIHQKADPFRMLGGKVSANAPARFDVAPGWGTGLGALRRRVGRRSSVVEQTERHQSVRTPSIGITDRVGMARRSLMISVPPLIVVRRSVCAFGCRLSRSQASARVRHSFFGIFRRCSLLVANEIRGASWSSGAMFGRLRSCAGEK